MTMVASRELRNRTRSLLERVENGETVTITVNGRPVALLSPLPERPGRIRREAFLKMLEDSQADPGLRDDLARLCPGTTDDLPL